LHAREDIIVIISHLVIIDEGTHVTHNPPCTSLGIPSSVPQPSVDNRDDEGQGGSINGVDKHSLEQHVEAGPGLCIRVADSTEEVGDQGLDLGVLNDTPHFL
jgi:hypothetical protein